MVLATLQLHCEESHCASQRVPCNEWREARLLLQGEGEVKILSRVLRPWTEVSPDDEHAIMALDSDMVLMALMVPNPNVFVLSEPARYDCNAWAQAHSA